MLSARQKGRGLQIITGNEKLKTKRGFFFKWTSTLESGLFSILMKKGTGKLGLSVQKGLTVQLEKQTLKQTNDKMALQFRRRDEHGNLELSVYLDILWMSTATCGIYLLQTCGCERKYISGRQAGFGVDLQQTPADLQQRGLTVKRKTYKQKEIASTSTERMPTQKPHPKVTNFKDQR
ncbi:hypothetical protein AAY473_028599 [Plecturocebus cupreus]